MPVLFTADRYITHITVYAYFIFSLITRIIHEIHEKLIGIVDDDYYKTATSDRTSSSCNKQTMKRTLVKSHDGPQTDSTQQCQRYRSKNNALRRPKAYKDT